MNREIKFKSLQELYDRLLPALKSKTKEINKKGFNYIHEEDIWNYLKNYKWTSSKALELCDMVEDIFRVEIKELDDYVKSYLKEERRIIDQKEI